MKKFFILVVGLVEKIGRTVKQSSDLKTSSIPLLSLEAQLSSLSLVAVFVDMLVCLVHSGFSTIFMVQSQFQYCCQSIKKIHIIIET